MTSAASIEDRGIAYLDSLVDQHQQEGGRLERVQAAISRLEDDPGALFEQSILDDITAIRQESPADWQRVRAAAKKARVQVGELDKLTRTMGSGESDQLFPTIQPWAEPVDGAALVRELSSTLRRFVVCEPEVADAAALWITFTWFIDEVHVAPIANITAPLPNCGKSTLLEFLETFVFQPLKCDGISPAALFRSMDKWQPTMLVDEVDTFLRDNEDARGVLNSGHRRNGFIIRVVGDDHEPKRFATWGAKALCGIGSIASTLASRSIRLELRRKMPDESAENIRFMEPELRDRLQRQLARLHEDLAPTVAACRPKPVPGLSNRAADNWEPLQQVAEAIGGEWPERVKVVAITVARMDDEDQASDIGTELLKDIKSVFDERMIQRIHTASLVEALHGTPEAPWNSWNRGKPITDRQVAAKLVEFGIKSKRLRIGETNKRGYELADFKDAFQRYLSPGTPSPSGTMEHSNENSQLDGFGSGTQGVDVPDGFDAKPLKIKNCSNVPLGSPHASEKNGEEF
ncbi:DUF3631 domain-containing protein [Halomonas smyrnensis]|uniref:DUF3631 domain-containing protein n=1 Tax=Halomonas smyrnensis TaxID=720605 RepID=UPI00030934CC|nr:DUF3631 domain-containing protein [Halomonas smyrnensis]